MKPWTALLACVLLLGAPFPTHAAGEPSYSLAVPLLELGARADYGHIVFEVQEVTEIMDRAGRSIAALSLGIQSLNGDHTPARSYVALHSMMRESIQRLDDPRYYDVSWRMQGHPELFGASALQGRSFSIGSTWEIEGECTGCTQPVRVSIHPPSDGSPPGTSYVATVTVFLKNDGDVVYTAHMGTEHAFPLAFRREKWHFVETSTLQSYTPGHTAILVGDLTPTTYPKRDVVSFENNRPVEGEPWAGIRSWAEARERTGLDDGATTEDSIFAYLKAGTSLRSTTMTAAGEFRRIEEQVWESRYAFRGEDDLVTRHTERVHYPGLLPGDPLTFWSGSSSRADTWAQPADECTMELMPFWEAIDLARDLGFLDRGLWGYHVHAGDCVDYELTAIPESPPSPGFSLNSQRVTVDLRTGLLIGVRLIVE